MSQTPSPTGAADFRMLAAIVFTDVTGFSARMQVEETAVLRLLDRDFAVMRQFAANHAGRVIKSTGDGLLLYFTSAVQAVSWALETQRHFAAQARTLARDEVLRHRVGVHLGDVFLGSDDVMGDGVNIAARVQTEAPPGGICISQTVYDVVKNKLELRVARLEPRRLKNIREIIPMYHVQLEAAPAVAPPRSARPVAATTSAAKDPQPRRTLPVVLLLLALLCGIGAVVYQYLNHERDLARSRREHTDLADALRNRAGVAVETPGPGRAGQVIAEEFDFLALARRATPVPSEDASRAERQARESITALESWLTSELQQYSASRPLRVARLDDAGLPQSVFTEKGQLAVSVGGAVRHDTWERYGVETRAAIIMATLRAATTRPPRSVVRGAEAFAYLNRQGTMAEALQRDLRR